MELPTHIQTLIVPQYIIERSIDLLAPFRARQVEGCLLWFGHPGSEGDCTVLTVVRPDQENKRGFYSISAASMRAVRHVMRPQNLLLLMQIHTHPKESFFSEWDAKNALNKRQGALNMVIEDFGKATWITPGPFNIVEMDEIGEWQPWAAGDWRRLKVVASSKDFYRGAL